MDTAVQIFLQALDFGKDGVLHICDINPVPVLVKNHKVLIKNALELTMDDLDNEPIDLVFSTVTTWCRWISIANWSLKIS